MTNEELIRDWKTLTIKFQSDETSITMLEMFLLCSGETIIDVNGTMESVVVFYQGYNERGSPAIFFKSDKNDNCITFGYDSVKKTHINSKIGKFIRLTTTES